MPSLTEVAKQAGVSLATASMVLNPGKQHCRVSEACAQRVRNAAEQLGYVANYHAQSMKLGRAGVIAVALDLGSPGKSRHSELGSTYFGTILGAIELYTRNLGYHMTIVGPDETLRAPERGLLGLKQRRFDGLIVPAVVYRKPPQFMIDAPHVPIVVIEFLGETQLPVVDWDESAGVALAVQHFKELGHRELLWLGPADEANRPPSRREQSFVNAAREAGIKTSSCHFEYPGSDYKDYRAAMADTAEVAMTRHLKEHRRKFTGVLCYNDVVGIGACGALAQAGLSVPGDVSVIGFDDVESSIAIPRMTSVSHKLHDMGLRAAELVWKMVGDEASRESLRGHREIIQPELVVRKSTGPAKHV